MKMKKEDAMRSQHRRELLLYGTILVVSAIAGAYYPFYTRFLQPGIDFKADQLGNPWAVGWLWGALGIFVPVGVVLFFWGGIYRLLKAVSFGTGVIVWLLMVPLVVFLVYSYLYDVNKTWDNEDQRSGMIFGWVGALILLCSYRVMFLALRGQPARPFRYRIYGGDVLARNDYRNGAPYDEQARRKDEDDVSTH